jgi:hypothetical protein
MERKETGRDARSAGGVRNNKIGRWVRRATFGSQAGPLPYRALSLRRGGKTQCADPTLRHPVEWNICTFLSKDRSVGVSFLTSSFTIMDFIEYNVWYRLPTPSL